MAWLLILKKKELFRVGIKKIKISLASKMIYFFFQTKEK